MPKRYVEDGTRKLNNSSFLPADVYNQCIRAMVVVCADTILVNRDHRTIYLAKRTALPWNHWWIIGGRVAVGETEIEAVRRTFHRETSLDIPEQRFYFLRMNRYWWKNREQAPRDVMTDALAYTFILEPFPQEIEIISLHLEAREYDPSVGLVEFSRSNLVIEGVHECILDMYDQIFPEVQNG
jgi:hypothetical protein